MSHFSSPMNFKQPTIDLTCCCKKDRDENIIKILSPFLVTVDFSIVLKGDFALHDEDLKALKLWDPRNNLTALFIA